MEILMDLDKLKKELIADEGQKLNENGEHIIYLDHLGYKTFGYGTLVTEWDEEYDYEVGTVVSQERVDECFKADIEITIEDCNILYSNFNDIPEEAQLIIANMMFNLGRPRLSKFKGMKSGVDSRDWNKAADEMVDSAWYRQVTNRAERLVRRMRAIDE